MSQMPPGEDLPEDADERYRRASALETSRPGDATRAAIFAYAARVAQQRVHGQQAASATAPLARPRRVIWRRAFAFGGLAVAALAGLTVVSRWPLLPTAPTNRQAAGAPSQAVVSAQRTAPGLQPQSPAAAAPPVHKEEDPASQARREPYPAPARPDRPPGEGPSVARARGEALAHTEVQASAQSGVTVAPAAASRVQSAQSGEQLRAAAARGDLGALRRLLATRAPLDGRDPQGRTALMQAVLHDDMAAAQTLLTAGADPNVPDAEGTTPLSAAQAASQPAMAQLLRQYGAR